MKAIILAGGHATRLWPVTKNKAKPLLPLAGRPIKDYILDDLDNYDEIDKIYITTNKKFKDSFNRYLESRDSDKYELVIEDQGKEEEKFGALGGIVNVLEDKEEDDYLIIAGDNYYTFDITNFIEFSLEKGSISNACFRLDDAEEAKNYGIVDYNDENKITKFEEKPANPPSLTASTACYFFPEEKIDIFDKYVDYWQGRIPKEKYLDEPGRLLQWASKRHDVYAYPFSGMWADVGTLEGYLRAEKEIKDNNIIEGRIKNCELGDNVSILGNSEVKNSRVQNCIIFSGAKIINSEVKNAIIGEGSVIKDLDIRDALIKNVTK